MRDAISRLRALQFELESLRRTTARVLAESERLIGELEHPTVPAPHPRSVGRVRSARTSAARSRRHGSK